MQIRNSEETDFGDILCLNEAEELQTSPMNLERLRFLDGLSSYHKVAVVDGRVAGFLLAIREDAAYQNDNYGWFAARYPKFVYVDRIVVSREFSGMKLGSALYEDLFKFARDQGVGVVVCEFNIEPPNPGSESFHKKWGFNEVGTQLVANNSKLVSLQLAET